MKSRNKKEEEEEKVTPQKIHFAGLQIL